MKTYGVFFLIIGFFIVSGLTSLDGKEPAAAPGLSESGFCKTSGKSRLISNLESGKQQTVVTYGTSLTGLTGTNFLTDSADWVLQLQSALNSRYPDKVKMINSGQCGMWSKWGKDNLDERVIAKKPDTVLIEFAINDAYLPYETSVEQAQINLENMIDRILKSNSDCEIILMVMNPPTGVHLERRPRIKDYYQMYRDVAKERMCLLIDHYPRWEKILNEDPALFKKYVPDGIHPGTEGCKMVITPEIIESLETKAKQSDFRKNCPPIAFLKRPAHGRKGTNATMLGQRTAIGSSICIYDPAKPDEGAMTIFKTEKGFIFDMSASYNGKKLLFSYMDDIAKGADSFHIWQINIDGTNLTQITKGPYHDASAVYLPDGRIVFCSTRVESFSLCQDFLAAAMYIIDGDGSNLRRLEYNTLCDVTPFVLDNGSILFTRWEYQDKNIFSVQGLWTINPDGSRVQLFYGNTITIPNAIYGAKQIPGTSKILCLMAGHHQLPVGAIAVIDRSLGLENPRAMTNITPEVPYRPTVGRNWKDTNWRPGDGFYPFSYADPYPISDKLFVAVYGGMKKGPGRYSIYLMDYQGNKVMLYFDPDISCCNPIPLQERPLPHIMPGQVPKEPKGQGTFFVSDIYEGLTNKGVKRGQVKQLMIMAQPAKKYNTEGPRYHDHYPVVGQGSYYPKVCLGTVPVDENGSVYFTAPAGIELYFIALDKDGKEIRRMGSVTQITDGETQSCIGCHESRFKAPALNTGAMTRLSKKPDAITPMPWGAGAVNYAKQVQPVLDKYCIKCHSGRNPKARMDLSGGKTRFYNMSYRSLVDRRLVEYYYINPGPTGNFPPLASGSWVSKLTKVIESNHSDVNMDDQSRRRIYNWIDANVPYYDTWDMTRPHTMGGRDLWHYVENNKRSMPKRQPWFAELEDIYMNNCSSCHGRISNQKKSSNDYGDISVTNAWINLTNPEYSRLLNAHLAKDAGGMGIVKQKDEKSPPVFADTTDQTYQAMLNAIESGKKALYDRPRVDMDGAVPIAQQRNFGKLY